MARIMILENSTKTSDEAKVSLNGSQSGRKIGAPCYMFERFDFVKARSFAGPTLEAIMKSCKTGEKVSCIFLSAQKASGFDIHSSEEVIFLECKDFGEFYLLKTSDNKTCVYYPATRNGVEISS